MFLDFRYIVLEAWKGTVKNETPAIFSGSNSTMPGLTVMSTVNIALFSESKHCSS